MDIIKKDTEGSINVGSVIGSAKWFNDKLGYGFITVISGDEKDKDIFVHHSDIKPLKSNYRSLVKGEYLQFDISEGINGPQAVNVTGIAGGALMCDNNNTRQFTQQVPYSFPVQQMQQHEMYPTQQRQPKFNNFRAIRAGGFQEM